VIGAIVGDIVGSVYEFSKPIDEGFELFMPSSRFTDDTVMSVAVADAILTDGNYAKAFRRWGKVYPHAGYGGMFHAWLTQPWRGPYKSFGNGSAMRVSPVGFAFDTEKEVLAEAKRSAECTHNHKEGIKGAQATALAIFMGRKGASKREIIGEMEMRFGYDLSRYLQEIRKDHVMDASCQVALPVCLTAFMESSDFEDAIRKSVALGGDTDTQGAITGGIAQGYYKEIPAEMLRAVEERLTPDLLEVVRAFAKKYM
jgi:ADP-ribosylglycohydrolase